MKSRLPILLVLSGALLATAWWWLRRDAPPSPGRVRSGPATAAPDPRKVDPDVLAQWQGFEAAARRADAEVWAMEREAERHEAVLIDIWDRIRSGGDPLSLLAPDGLERVVRAEPGDVPETLGELRRDRGAGPIRTLDRAAWRDALAGWRQAGWHLEGMEWRMPGFVPPKAGREARSMVDAEFHLRLARLGERRTVRARLDLTWAAPGEAGDPPSIREVRVVSWEAVSRRGDPWFTLVAREEVAPEAGAIHVDPLLVRDLDGNGFVDVVLAGKNRVYVNHGAGNLQARRLATGLDSILISALLIDADGDGHVDLVGIDAGGVVVVRGDGRLPMASPPERQPIPGLQNPFSLAAGDVDGDGDIDLWLGQYKVPYRMGQMPVPYFDALDGFPAHLLVNDGGGRFEDRTVAAGLAPKRNRRTYGAGFVDVDGDGDLDLVNVSDFAGVDLFRNDGTGRFEDVTSDRLPDPWVFGMGLVVADLDRDLWPDLLAIGMNSPVADRLEAMGLGPADLPGHRLHRPRMSYGNRWWRNRGDGSFEAAPGARQLAATGWSWGAVVADFDNDGDDDFHVVNGHKSGVSARDYETDFWTHDIHLTTETNLNPGLDLYFQSVASRRYGAGDSYGGHQRNQLRVRGGQGEFVEAGWVLGAGLEADSRNLVAADLDNDGRLDLVVTTARFGEHPGQDLRILRNQGPDGRWLDVDLPGAFPGSTGAGHVELETTAGRRREWIVPGDGYRSQGPARRHFGLAPGEVARRVRVWFPGGREAVAEVAEGSVTVPARDFRVVK